MDDLDKKRIIAAHARSLEMSGVAYFYQICGQTIKAKRFLEAFKEKEDEFLALVNNI